MKTRVLTTVVMVMAILITPLAIRFVWAQQPPELSPEEAIVAGTWTSKASMPTPRDHAAAVALDGKVYVMGGRDSHGALASMLIYDPVANTWSSKANMPGAKSVPGVAVVNGRIYVMGPPDAQVYEYNPATNSWAIKSPLPVAPSGRVAVAAISGHIFVAFNTGDGTRPSLYMYDPFQDTWQRRRSHPDVRSIASLGIANGMVYAVGGNFPGQSPSETTRVDRYDPMNDTWTTDVTPRLATRRTNLGPTLPTVGGKMYVIGGWDGYSTLSSVEVYDPWNNTWTSETPMPTARYTVAYAAVDYKIYAIGGNHGGAGGNWLTTNEELALPEPTQLENPIAFVSDRDGYYEIYTMNPDGSRQLRITNDGCANWHPSWTPGGTRILFSVDCRRNRDIYSMNPDGSDWRRLTTDPQEDTRPAMSPDGQKIAFLRRESPGVMHPWVMNAYGSDQHPLISGLGTEEDTALTWSPDSRQLVFRSTRGGNWQLWRINVDSTGLTQLTNLAGEPYDPAWSPDGSTIAFSSESDLRLMNPDGTNIRTLPGPGWEVRPSWSPDSARLAYISWRGGANAEIYSKKIDNTDERNLSNNPANDWDPAWARPVGACVGGWNVSNVRLNGDGTSVTVNPGESVRLQYDFQIWNGTTDPNSIRQLVAGLVKDSWSQIIDDCAYNSIPATCPNKTSGSFDHTFIAPTNPGTYQVVIANDAQYSCTDAKDRFPNQTGKQTVGSVIVSPLRTVRILIDPSPKTVSLGEIFTLNIKVSAGSQPVDSVDSYLSFDRNYLRVVDANGSETNSIIPGGTLPVVLQNSADNSQGRIAYSAGRQLGGTPPSGDFVLATIRFKAIATTPGTPIAFQPGTDVFYQGDSVLGSTVNGNVTISTDTQTYTISGWVTDDTGAPVADATISASGPANVSTTTGSDGSYIIANLPAGTYSVSASKTGYTSPPARSVTVPPDATNVDFVLQRVTQGQIAFVSDRDGYFEIYKMNPDGSSQIRLTNSPCAEWHASWSPNGQKIAFAADCAGNFDIYTMNSDGSDWQQLTASSKNEYWPAWSPDGQKITFLREESGFRGHLYVMNADGTGLTQLTSGSPQEFGLSTWSPDGQFIAFASINRDVPRFQIYRVNAADGSNVVRLTNTTYDTTFPAWSPDGTRIAFMNSADIIVMNADGSNIRNLTDNSASNGWPAWSPDSGRIAFHSSRSGKAQIYVVNDDGTDQHNVSNTSSNDWGPHWSRATVTPGCGNLPTTPHFTIYYGDALLNGQPVPVGAVVEAFSPRGHRVGCFQVTSAGVYGYMRVYGEDATASPPIPGMRAGEEITFKINGTQARPSVCPVRWQDDKTPHEIDLTAPGACPMEQRISLHRGWNWFSINRQPSPTDPGSALSPISGKYDLVLGEEGTYAPPPADPRFNTLRDILPGKGYMVRVTQDATEPNPLVVQGNLVAPSTPISLLRGWRWLGYLSERTLDIPTALTSIAEKFNLLLGEAGTYAPPPADPRFNTLHKMEPGRGYLIRMTQDGTLIHPAAMVEHELRTQTAEEVDRAAPGQVCDVPATPYFTQFYGEVRVDGQPAPAGVFVEAFSPRGDRVGCFEVTNPGLYGYMRVYGEDTTANPPIPGMRTGEMVTFKVNGRMAQAAGDTVWQDDKVTRPVDLAAEASYWVYLPVVLRRRP